MLQNSGRTESSVMKILRLFIGSRTPEEEARNWNMRGWGGRGYRSPAMWSTTLRQHPRSIKWVKITFTQTASKAITTARRRNKRSRYIWLPTFYSIRVAFDACDLSLIYFAPKTKGRREVVSVMTTEARTGATPALARAAAASER